MFSFKRSLITIVGILVISVALATLLPFAISGQDKPLKRDARRAFYLTQTTHDGSQALSACAEGYHMASLWEIFDTSNLRYDTELGVTRADSGSGPPSGSASGWIRTGGNSSGAPAPGSANCSAWTSTVDNGTTLGLNTAWASTNCQPIDPWATNFSSCSQAQSVWCVQN